MKSARCKKDVGLWRRRKDWTEMDEASKRDVHFYPSSPYMSIYICFTIRLDSHCPRLLLHSIVLMEFREGVRGEIKTVKLYCCDPLLHWDVFLSASLTAVTLQDHLYTNIRSVKNRCVKTHTRLLAVSKKNGQIL